MAVRIKAKNFQSIEDAEILVEGLTVLTGTNNAGKTAFIRAFLAVFTNPSLSENIVRVGSNCVEVEIEFDDGNLLIWKKGKEKGKTLNQYTINGTVFDNVDRGAPEEVLSFGICPVECGKELFWPQIAMQGDNVSFVLNRPGTVIAEAVVADIEKVTLLNRCLSLGEKEKRDKKSEIKIRKSDLESLSEKIRYFSPVEEDLKKIQDFNLKSFDFKLRELLFLQTKFEEITTLQTQLKTFDNLPENIKIFDLENLYEKIKLIQELKDLEKSFIQTTDLFKRLSTLEDLVFPKITLPTLNNINELALFFQQRKDFQSKIKEIEESITRLEEEIREFECESQDLLKQGTCPLCNSFIDFEI